MTALARGLEVLRCFTPERIELGTTELAALSGLPQPTVWRLCHTLTRLGCLVPGRNPEKLRIGLATLTLGQACLTHAGIADVAYPSMQEIANRFGGSVSLAGRDRRHMVIVQRAEAPTILRLHLHVGSALPIERSALGWAYFSAADAEERESVVRSIAATAAGDLELRARLEALRATYLREGFVMNLRHYHPEVNALGVAVVAAGGRKVMALNCGGACSVLTPQLLAGPVAHELTALAGNLSRLLTLQTGAEYARAGGGQPTGHTFDA